MDHRCAPCASLTFEALMELAQAGFRADEFPKEVFYQRHELYFA